MASVVSVKTNATNQSRHSDTRSAVSGYSRGASAYSQRHKNLLAQEQKKDLEDLLQRQHAEQERHRRLMIENKQRAKMHKEQLRKELETKRQQEEEYLSKMKEDKKTAYIKYLKENSKELLQNFKKKEPATASGKEESRDVKKGSQGDISTKRMKSLPAELPSRKGQKNSIGNIRDNGKNMDGQMNKIPEEAGKNVDSDEHDNLDALDLDISRSTNNFKRILDQYHKEMEQLEKRKKEGDGHNKQQGLNGIPLQKFYDEQNNHYNKAPQSKLLESLDLGSSIAHWNTKNNKENEYKSDPMDNYEDDEQEEVEENIEIVNDDSDEENTGKQQKNASNTRPVKTLTKVSDLSNKQKKNDWYLKYLDNQSQNTSNQPSRVNISNTTPSDAAIKSTTGAPVLKNTNPKSLDCIPNYDQTPISEPLNLKPRLVEKKNEMLAANGPNDYKFHWANDVKEDDFYKGLSQQVKQTSGPLQNLPDNNRNILSMNRGVKPQSEKNLTAENIAKLNTNDAASVVSSKSQAKVGAVHGRAPLARKKAPSVTSIAKKSINEKENNINRKNSGIRSKLEDHVSAAQRMGKPGRKLGKVMNKKALSPETKGTRDTDLDVEEFLQDDFNMLNQEERALQQEIVEIHKNKISKVRDFEKKHNINTQYQNTKQLVNKAVDNIPFADKVIDEEDLEQSLDRLDVILAKHRAGVPMDQVQASDFNPQSQPQPQPQFQPQPYPAYQKETSLLQQVMHGAPNNMASNPFSGPYHQGQSYNIYSSNPTNFSNQMAPTYNYPNYAGGYPGSGYIDARPQQFGNEIGVVSPEFGQKVYPMPSSHPVNYYPTGNQQVGLPLIRPQNTTIEANRDINIEPKQMQGGYSRSLVDSKVEEENFEDELEKILGIQEEKNKREVPEKSSRYALKKQQQNQHKMKKQKENEEREQEEEGTGKVVANANLKHLLLG